MKQKFGGEALVGTRNQGPVESPHPPGAQLIVSCIICGSNENVKYVKSDICATFARDAETR